MTLHVIQTLLVLNGVQLWASSNVAGTHMLRIHQFMHCWLNLEYVKLTEVILLSSQGSDIVCKGFPCFSEGRCGCYDYFSAARKAWICCPTLTFSHELLPVAHTYPTHARVEVSFSCGYKYFIFHNSFIGLQRNDKLFSQISTFLTNEEKMCTVWKSSSMKKKAGMML